MDGRTNFDPQHLDQFLGGNTVEENSALRGMASRLVDQQLAAEPAPSAIEVTIPQRGKVLTFERSLQVQGEEALRLELEVAQEGQTKPGVAVALLAMLGLIVFAATRRR